MQTELIRKKRFVLFDLSTFVKRLTCRESAARPDPPSGSVVVGVSWQGYRYWWNLEVGA